MQTLMADYSHQQIADLVAYIRTFEPGSRSSTLGGDPQKGKALYQSCIASHAVDGQGIPALNSPNLLGQSDVYVVNQLLSFKRGVRGSGSGDKEGKMMQLAAKVIPDEQAMKDLAAYLGTLSEKPLKQ